MPNHSDPLEVVGTGFAVLDRLYAYGGIAMEALGGSCGNVLVSLAMLQRQVAPVLSLGLDETGERLIGEFRLAGADVRYITRRRDMRSPVLTQELDTDTGRHRFSFTCSETNTEFPRYEPINANDVAYAAPALAACAVFYTDRMSASILEAMATAHSSGAIIFFEPSDVERDGLFERALGMTTILKYSADRLGAEIDGKVADSRSIAVVTHGADGLEIRHRHSATWCKAIPATRVTDTCGSGDMVSVGLIDWLLTQRSRFRGELTIADILRGVIAGQHLAAANCAFAGARGLFQHMGAAHARRILTACLQDGAPLS